MAEQNINFEALVSQIQSTNGALQNNARLVINRHVTAKAWLTGYYIVEYELNGVDRAYYGERLLQNLAGRLNTSTFSYRSLKLYKQFYLTYKSLDVQVSSFIMSLPQIRQTVSAQLSLTDNEVFTIRQSLSAQLPVAKNEEAFVQTNPELLFNKLSFSHLTAILPCKVPHIPGILNTAMKIPVRLIIGKRK